MSRLRSVIWSLLPQSVRSRLRRLIREIRARGVPGVLPPLAAVLLKEFPDAVALGNGASGRVGKVNRGTNSTGILREHTEAVAEVLDRAKVSYFLVPNEPGGGSRIGVRDAERSKALRALAASGKRAPAYVRIGTRRPVLARDLAEADLDEVGAVAYFFYWADEQGNLLTDHSLACTVEFWADAENGMLVGPRPNPVATEVPPALAEPAEATAFGRTWPSLQAFDQPNHIDRMRFEIDFVYTWVDGADAAWLERKQAALQAGEGWHTHAASESRFHSRDELRYSLRSAWMYADFFRKIYLVTDQQVPPWLDTSDPRIEVVDHRDIFGNTGRLPTFNSHAIESRLHHIDGLSEHFLYLNDDVFFGRRTPPSTFFHSNGVTKFTMSRSQFGVGPKTSDDLPPEAAGKNNRQLLVDRFGMAPTQKIKHTPHPLRRSVLEEMEKSFPDEFSATASHQFRSVEDISPVSSLYQYYAFCTNRAVPAGFDYQYINLSLLDEDRLNRLLRKLIRRRPQVFCLNDVDVGETRHEHRDSELRRFLDTLYPVPSPFELRSVPDSLPGDKAAQALKGGLPS